MLSEQILETEPNEQQLYGYLYPISQTIQDEQDMLGTAREPETNFGFVHS